MTDGSRPRDRGAMEELGRSIGETAGRMAGKAADMAAEMAAPLVRGAADVLGGWWSEQSARDAARDIDPARDRRWREHYEGFGATGKRGTTGTAGTTSRTGSTGSTSKGSAGTTVSGAASVGSTGSPGSTGSGSTSSSTGRSYEDVRPYYQLGHTASRNPEYATRNFDEVEPDLQRVWDEGGMGEDRWPEARGYVEFGYGEGKAHASAEGELKKDEGTG